jgi:hypothetical protein
MVSSVFILLPFLTVSQHESGTRTTISWSVIIYSKIFSSQGNLTAQIEPVQDKYMYSLFTVCLHYIKSMINSFFLGAAIVIYGSWIYNYRFNQCLSPLKLWVQTLFMVMCTWYNIMWSSLSVTCDRLVIFSSFLDQ